jgi:two-component system, cell cycle sensor histidine kinase and response regulator CckA
MPTVYESRARVTSARALRFLAFVVVAVAVGRHLTGPQGPDASQMLAIRLGAAGLAMVLALLCTPRRSLHELRLLGFLLGMDASVSGLVVVAITPSALWEQISLLMAVMLGAAVFMPWSWRWQAGFAALNLAGTVIVLLSWIPSAERLPEVPRLLLTVTLVAAASVAGAHFADAERQRVVASEARYRGLFHGAGDAIAILDADGRIREANPRCLELLRRPTGEVLGQSLSQFYVSAASDAPRAPVPAALEHAAALRGEVRHASHVIRQATGGQVEVDITFARADSPDGPIVQAVLRDLTEQRSLERRRVRDQRLDSLTRLAGGFAHQFNNLLGGILTHASVLREDASQAAARAELDEVIAATRRGRDLTKELLRFTRHAPIALRPTSVAEVAASVGELARTTLPENAIVEVRVTPGLPAMMADPDHLVQACLEVVLNARDAMRGPEPPRMTIAVAEETVRDVNPKWPDAAPGRYIRVSVTDTGVGMDAATLERVFEPFFTTKPMHQAAGIGLAQVYSVVREHRGVVRIDSAPRRGSTVHLLIPVSAEQPQVRDLSAVPPLRIAERGSGGEAAVAPRGPGGVAEPAATAGGTILVVDDEAIVRSSLRRALTHFGYRVLEATDGGTALAALQSADPRVDLVILDLVLPGGGAGIFEVLKAVRPDLKVLVSSGYSPDEENARALADRADGFLPKPYEIAELRRTVARVLGRAAA